MTTFITRRVLQTFIVIFLLSYFCYFIMTLMPGDPVELMIQSNPKITSADIERLKNLYGLDQPVYERYFHWAKDLITGNLGYSRQYKVPVTEIMGPKLLNTFALSAASLILSLLIAIPLGILSALKAGSKLDYVINFFAFAGISVPSFWLALVLIIIFAVTLNWLPAGGTYNIGEASGIFGPDTVQVRYLILPTMSLAYLQIGRFLRFTRSAMLESMRNDYIRTAKAKGLANQAVIWKHGFRNALIPLITILALSFSSLFSGALITETVFAFQGVGKLVYDSIISNDYNVAMISFMISVTMVLLMSLVADILYGVADPRISYK